jgi:6-phosphogluconolactonase
MVLPLYIGTYSERGSEGIYTSALDTETGALAAVSCAAEAFDPTFLALAPSGRVLYAACGLDAAGAGAVRAWTVAPNDGVLAPLGTQPTGGARPCHVAADRTGAAVLTADYHHGSFAVFPVAADGTPGPRAACVAHTGRGPNPARQDRAHVHSVTVAPDNRFILVADLGIDRIRVYRLDAAAAAVDAHAPPGLVCAPGAGPRHLAFHPDGTVVYVLNELDATVIACRYNAERGALTAFQTIASLPDGFDAPNTAAEIRVSADGRFVYASNRGHDSLAVFAVAPGARTLSLVEHVSVRGRHPRHFALAPDGRHLVVANRDTDGLVAFRIDPASGRLTPTGAEQLVPAPVCVLFRLPRALRVRDTTA